VKTSPSQLPSAWVSILLALDVKLRRIHFTYRFTNEYYTITTSILQVHMTKISLWQNYTLNNCVGTKDCKWHHWYIYYNYILYLKYENRPIYTNVCYRDSRVWQGHNICICTLYTSHTTHSVDPHIAVELAIKHDYCSSLTITVCVCGSLTLSMNKKRKASFCLPNMNSGVVRIWCRAGHTQKLLDFYRTTLSTYCRCQTVYSSKCTERNKLL